jgi:hypothetical protein
MTPCQGRLHSFQQRLAAEAFSNLAGIVGHLLPATLMERLSHEGQRRRLFAALTTFWGFLAQVLSPGQPCREALRQIQAARRRQGRSAICSCTSAYCKARRRLPERILQAIWQEIAAGLGRSVPQDTLWRGYRVGVVDGTGVSMPDTAANQALWPQPSAQRRGCGFPVMKLVGLFSLATGAMHALVMGNLHQAEQILYPHLWTALTGDFDLLLGDRNFGSFSMFCALRQCGLQGVFRLNQCRKVDWRKGKRLGKFDRLVTWNRPVKLTWWLPEPAPEKITVRILKVCVPITGFRTRVLFISTTLLDAEQFPAHALAELYRRRWQVELFFRHVKTTMHMDVLRCLTPEMIRRELHMHMIAYNIVRGFMLQSARTYHVPVCRISFKGTCDTLRQWAPHLAAAAAIQAIYSRLFRWMLEIIADDEAPLRPNRSEPRAVKRRPKNYRRLTKPRHLMGNLPHRNRPR